MEIYSKSIRDKLRDLKKRDEMGMNYNVFYFGAKDLIDCEVINRYIVAPPLSKWKLKYRINRVMTNKKYFNPWFMIYLFFLLH